MSRYQTDALRQMELQSSGLPTLLTSFCRASTGHRITTAIERNERNVSEGVRDELEYRLDISKDTSREGL
jgi:hypothetical protein